jgi:hypothetical protein
MPHSVSSETDTPVPVPITVAGIREMGQVKLEKRQKAWLVEAVNACLAHIDLLEDGNNDSKVRVELRELKKAVFVDAANAHGSVPADTHDYLDRSDT